MPATTEFEFPFGPCRNEGVLTGELAGLAAVVDEAQSVEEFRGE